MRRRPQMARGVLDTASESPEASSRSRRQSGRDWGYAFRSWLGLVPFLLFCLLFEILPAIIIIQGSFTDDTTGSLTLNNYQHMLSQAGNLRAFENSIYISLVTAVLGGFIWGF